MPVMVMGRGPCSERDGAGMEPRLRAQLPQGTRAGHSCELSSLLHKSCGATPGTQGDLSLCTAIRNYRGSSLKKQQNVRGTVTGILSASLISRLGQIKERSITERSLDF